MKAFALVYIGAGAFLPGVPARDLTPAEVATYGGEAALLASGLYTKAREDKKLSGPLENKGV